jgi:hypothetical protein
MDFVAASACPGAHGAANIAAETMMSICLEPHPGSKKRAYTTGVIRRAAFGHRSGRELLVQHLPK